MECVYTQSEIGNIAKILIKKFDEEKKQHATLVCLSGDLGAGKTTLVQEIAAKYKITETVVSPTYVILKSYSLENSESFSRLVHIDAYRLESEEELVRLGWNELMSDPATIIFLEWPEKVPSLVTSGSFLVTLTHHTHDSRKMVLVRYTT